MSTCFTYFISPVNHSFPITWEVSTPPPHHGFTWSTHVLLRLCTELEHVQEYAAIYQLSAQYLEIHNL